MTLVFTFVFVWARREAHLGTSTVFMIQVRGMACSVTRMTTFESVTTRHFATSINDVEVT